METVRYAKDKPRECRYCYWWDPKLKECSRINKKCYYILTEVKKNKKESPCNGCPYGRVYPCVGYCLQKLMMNNKEGGS